MHLSVSELALYSSSYKNNPLYINEESDSEMIQISLLAIVFSIWVLVILTFLSIFPDLKEWSKATKDFNLKDEFTYIQNIFTK